MPQQQTPQKHSTAEVEGQQNRDYRRTGMAIRWDIGKAEPKPALQHDMAPIPAQLPKIALTSAQQPEPESMLASKV